MSAAQRWWFAGYGAIVLAVAGPARAGIPQTDEAAATSPGTAVTAPAAGEDARTCAGCDRGPADERAAAPRRAGDRAAASRDARAEAPAAASYDDAAELARGNSGGRG